MLTQERDLMALSDVLEMLQVSRATLYKFVSERGFPQPLKLGRSNRWLAIEVAAWLEGQPRASIRVEDES